ncbi:MAG: PQQ-binding-like beta-propeller repeat protein [Planctomycetes bacterium]|nr:PQQ-binding-like beta-propeller repeat protein [Planctomycetota bacterium]MBL7041450.1 PQQ-binding-like beta-propeller repeat protein [Pirellulaceae bacterium]
MECTLKSHGVNSPTRQRIDLRVWMMLQIVLVAAAPGLAYEAKTVADLYSFAGIRGGVVVQLGVEDGKEIAALRSDERFLVQGLDEDRSKIARVRENLASKGIHGAATVREFDGRHLPYVDNMVNLIVVSDRFSVSEEEILRVLVPGGTAAFIDQGSNSVQRRLTKPQPEDTDEWTHYLYDAGNNAVSKDTRIDSMRRQQWVGGPRWSRHHDHIAGLTAMVSTGGRIFYVMDEGKNWSVLLPSKHFLIARDAFNGTILWKKPLASWHPHLWPLKSGPAQLPRRLVAQGKKLYMPLGMAEPLSVLDADSGEVLKTFPETKATEEVLLSDGVIYVLSNPTPELYEDFTLGDAHNGAQKGRVAREYPWNKGPRNLVVLDDNSGELRWKKQIVAAPLSLTVGSSNVLFFDGSQIVALDKANGAELWKSDVIKTKPVFAVNESPILVAYKDYVFFAGANRRMSAFSAETGERLWEAEHLRGGYCSPQDLFVIDDMVWSGAIDTPRNTGIFVGRDVRTGELRRDIPAQDVPYTFGHHRCHRAKATSRFILASKTGIEFYDIEDRKESVNHWVRGGCLYGIMPANGLIYAPMHSCACHLDSKLTGFNALAPQDHAKTEPTASPRLVKGEAYLSERDEAADDADWPTYRADNARSSFSPAPVTDGLRRKWQTSLTGKLSALTIGCGKVFVAAVDEHRLHALDQNTGKAAWSFLTGGRIDSPPTVFRGFVYFGCADGCIYSLAAADGQLAWRFRLAPDDSQLCSYGQLESVWPVSGSVLIKNGKLFCVGGRSSFLDGGLPFVRLDAMTGKLEAESTLDDFDVETGKSIQLLSAHSIMPSAIPDILSSDGENIFMRVEKLTDDGERIGSIEFDEERQYEERHIFSWAGFLEDSWLHRIYMSYGNGKLPLGTYLNWWTYGERNPDGRILVMDDTKIYGYGLKPKYHTWSSTFLDYQLFSVNKTIETDPITGPTIFGRKMGRTPQRQLRNNWAAEVPFYVRAMIKTSDKLIVCGPEKIIDEKGVIGRYPEESVLQELKQQETILDGQRGSHLWVVRAGDGIVLEKHKLPALPVWDGMATAQGHVYLATQNGVVCLGGEKTAVASGR